MVSTPLTGLVAVLTLLAVNSMAQEEAEITVFTECPNSCSGKGFCQLDGTCRCQDGRTGSDCSIFVCPNGTAWIDYPTANNVAHGLAPCSNMGTCDTTTGKCACREGFTGHSCNRILCLVDAEGLVCSGHGKCMSMRMAAKIQNDVTLFRSVDYDNWDADMMWGCVCGKGYGGPLCADKMCPTGDDPQTTSNTAYEKQILDCKAESGTFTLHYRDEQTPSINFNANAATIKAALETISYLAEGVTVAFDSSGSQPCTPGGGATIITFDHQPGDLPALTASATLLGHGSAAVVLSVFSDTASGAYGGPTASVTGNRENIECSGQGQCDYLTGICTCRTGFASSNGAGAAGLRGDCGHIATSPTTCDTNSETLVKCNDVDSIHAGKCVNENTNLARCDCVAATETQAGYAGAQCTTVVCPLGKPWFREAASANTRDNTLEICSGVGVCDRLAGTCTCPLWFAGVACEQLACPVTGKTLCMGQGKCENIAAWAPHSRDEDGNLRGVTYSETATSWEATRLYGCRCDRHVYKGPKAGNVVQAFGYACSRLLCPHGDIPETGGQHYEQQTIYCAATGGTFTLTFRGETTRPIAWNAIALASGESTGTTAGSGKSESVQSKIHNLVEITEICYDGSCTGVGVAFDSGSAVCSSSGTTTTLTFKSEFGDIPELTINSGSLTHSGSVVAKVYETVKGSKEFIECANRGICDNLKGQCKCHLGYISSDGDGNIGQRGDCGAYNVFQTTEGLDIRL